MKKRNDVLIASFETQQETQMNTLIQVFYEKYNDCGTIILTKEKGGRVGVRIEAKRDVEQLITALTKLKKKIGDTFDYQKYQEWKRLSE